MLLKSPEEERRELRKLVLVTAGVATVVLAACNGSLVWLYQHSSLGVVTTVATFIAAVALTWLRTKGRQFTVIVVAVQVLVAISAVVGILVGIRAGVFTGILASGITLAGLLLLSLIGLLHVTSTPTRARKAVSAASALAVVLSMVGAYAYLSIDYYENTYVPPYVAPPERSVDFLIETGQYYTGNEQDDDPQVVASFERYTCPERRDEIAAFFGELVEEGKQRLTTPEDVTVTERGKRGDTETATVTATISLVDDFDGTVLAGPETWTFYLEKPPSAQYWQVCEIVRPE